MRKTKLTGSAFAAALVLTAGVLTACGGDDATSDDDSATITDAAGAADAAGLEGSEALQAVQLKAEEYGYEDCMMAPDSAAGSDVVALHCFGNGDENLAMVKIYDAGDRESGAEVANAELDSVMEASEGEEYAPAREEMAGSYRPLDGEGVAGYCSDTSQKCEEVAEGFGLEIGMLDGALTSEEREQRAEEEAERSSREYEEKLKKEEEEKQRELQNYSGWDDLDQAKEQLRAWDISCRDEQAAKGKVAWCGLTSVLVAFDMSADDLEKQDVFKEVGREEMVSVSDGDWTVMCAPGARDTCDLIADKTGKSVKDGV